MLPAHVVVGWRVLASPIALDERYRTGQVSDLANGRVGRERYPTTCGAQNVTFSNRALVNPPLADPADKGSAGRRPVFITRGITFKH